VQQTRLVERRRDRLFHSSSLELELESETEVYTVKCLSFRRRLSYDADLEDYLITTANNNNNSVTILLAVLVTPSVIQRCCCCCCSYLFTLIMYFSFSLCIVVKCVVYVL